jgi:hypothetical protein
LANTLPNAKPVHINELLKRYFKDSNSNSNSNNSVAVVVVSVASAAARMCGVMEELDRAESSGSKGGRTLQQMVSQSGGAYQPFRANPPPPPPLTANDGIHHLLPGRGGAERERGGRGGGSRRGSSGGGKSGTAGAAAPHYDDDHDDGGAQLSLVAKLESELLECLRVRMVGDGHIRLRQCLKKLMRSIDEHAR